MYFYTKEVNREMYLIVELNNFIRSMKEHKNIILKPLNQW